MISIHYLIFNGLPVTSISEPIEKTVYIILEPLDLGIEDFAIRKGDTYNTGIYDLRNGSLFDNQNLLERILNLNFVAVVMDLAKSYHKFAKVVFANAIRIPDHFHVNRYIPDALHSIHKRVCKELSSYKTKRIKTYQR